MAAQSALTIRVMIVSDIRLYREALARALLKLVPNLDQRRQWSVAARERANREFSSKKCARRHAELLWPETAGH